MVKLGVLLLLTDSTHSNVTHSKLFIFNEKHHKSTYKNTNIDNVQGKINLKLGRFRQNQT